MTGGRGSAEGSFDPGRISVRYAVTGDVEALHRIFIGPRVIEGHCNCCDEAWCSYDSQRFTPHVYEKFEIKGNHRRFTFRDGGYADAHSMACAKG